MGNLEELLQDNLTADLAAKSTSDVRDLRNRCVQAETSLSYLRRITQGRLDIVRNDLTRREGGESPEKDLSTLIGDLPDILGHQPRPAGPGRLPQSLDPADVDPDLADALDAIASPSRLASIPEASDEEVAALASGLDEFERRVSNVRQKLFDQIDALQEELTRRYETGEANIDSLLT